MGMRWGGEVRATQADPQLSGTLPNPSLQLLTIAHSWKCQTRVKESELLSGLIYSDKIKNKIIRCTHDSRHEKAHTAACVRSPQHTNPGNKISAFPRQPQGQHDFIFSISEGINSLTQISYNVEKIAESQK